MSEALEKTDHNRESLVWFSKGRKRQSEGEKQSLQTVLFVRGFNLSETIFPGLPFSLFLFCLIQQTISSDCPF